MRENKTNIIKVAQHYLKALNIPFTNSFLKENFLSHPFYPSLNSLSGVFKKYNIDTEAYEITKADHDLLKPPYIAYLKNQPDKDFVLVTSANDSEVKYVSYDRKIKTVSTKKFLNDSQQIVFIASANENSKEPDYLIHKKKGSQQKNKLIFFFTALTFLIAAPFYYFFHYLNKPDIIPAAILLLIKIYGIAITVLLMIHKIDGSNNFIKRICTSGKKSNCDSILNSKAAKFLGISWSDVGFFYFTSSLFFLLCNGVLFRDKLSVLAIANGLAAPYIFYSIYYQWKIAKQWCRLCLLVQSALALELIWSIINFWLHPFFAFAFLSRNIFYIILSLVIPLILLYFVIPLIEKSRNDREYKFAYKRLIYNPDFFKNLLSKQQPAPNGFENLGITIGNPDASNTIIKVCNPYCIPCAKAHPILHDIIHQNKNVNLKVIFNASNDKKDKRGIIAKHLLAINDTQDALKTETAMDDWYLTENKNYETFAKKYPANVTIAQETQIEKMKVWCREAAIKGTPIFFINGKMLPDIYTIEDVKNIL